MPEAGRACRPKNFQGENTMSLKKIATRNVATLQTDATVLEAAKKMRDSHVGDVVIVKTEDGREVPVGILTDRDIVVSTVAFGVAPGVVTVEDVMAPTVTVAKTTDSLYHVLNLMKEHGIKRIPLVNSAGTLQGIVSSEDIVAILASELTDVVRITERQHDVEAQRRKRIA